MHQEHLKHVEGFPKRKRLMNVSYISLNLLMFVFEFLSICLTPALYIRLIISFCGLGLLIIDIYIIKVLYKVRLSRMIWQNSITKRKIMRTLAILCLILTFIRAILYAFGNSQGEFVYLVWGKNSFYFHGYLCIQNEDFWYRRLGLLKNAFNFEFPYWLFLLILIVYLTFGLQSFSDDEDTTRNTSPITSHPASNSISRKASMT